MANDGNTDKLKGSALLAGAAALIYLSRDKKPKVVPAPPAVKPVETKPNMVTVNVNTGPAVKPKPQVRQAKPKAPKRPGVRFQGPISVSDGRFDAVPAVMPKDFWKKEMTHWVRNPTKRLTFNRTNSMYDELQGLDGELDGGLEGRYIRRIRAERIRRGRPFGGWSQNFRRRLRAGMASAMRSHLKGEAKMRRALEILRRNGMF